jgi:hypothetical protein
VISSAVGLIAVHTYPQALAHLKRWSLENAEAHPGS